MINYQNLSGDSGIHAFEIGPDFIVVQFSTGGTYLYNYQETGKPNVDEMKRLAVAGRGLATYINKFVRKKYAQKIE